MDDPLSPFGVLWVRMARYKNCVKKTAVQQNEEPGREFLMRPSVGTESSQHLRHRQEEAAAGGPTTEHCV